MNKIYTISEAQIRELETVIRLANKERRGDPEERQGIWRLLNCIEHGLVNELIRNIREVS